MEYFLIGKLVILGLIIGASIITKIPTGNRH